MALLSREDSSDKMGDHACMRLQPSSSWARSSGCCSYGSWGGATNNNAATSPFALHGWDCAKRQLRTLICTRPPSALTSCLFSFPPPPFLFFSISKAHSYAYDRVYIPAAAFLTRIAYSAALFLLFANIVSFRDKLINKWGLPTAPAHRTTPTVLLRMTRTTKTTLLQHPITCPLDNRCDYWAVWTNQCIRMFYHLLSLGDCADHYIDQAPPTAPTTQTTNSRAFPGLVTAPQVRRHALPIPRSGTYPRTHRSRATAGPTRRSDTMHPRAQTPAGLAHSMRLRTPHLAPPSRA